MSRTTDTLDPSVPSGAFPARIWPELRLYAAILEDARLCLSSREYVTAETRAETRAWVDGAIASAPLCSFREICEMFMLDEAAVRRSLLGDFRRQRPSASRVHVGRPLRI